MELPLFERGTDRQPSSQRGEEPFQEKNLACPNTTTTMFPGWGQGMRWSGLDRQALGGQRRAQTPPKTLPTLPERWGHLSRLPLCSQPQDLVETPTGLGGFIPLLPQDDYLQFFSDKRVPYACLLPSSISRVPLPTDSGLLLPLSWTIPLTPDNYLGGGWKRRQGQGDTGTPFPPPGTDIVPSPSMPMPGLETGLDDLPGQAAPWRGQTGAGVGISPALASPTLPTPIAQTSPWQTRLPRNHGTGT